MSTYKDRTDAAHIVREASREPCEPFGPQYPKLGASVAKHRKIKNPTAEQRVAHGDAVAEAIRALQRSALARELPTIKPSCASGTWHNNGDGKVGDAVREQQARALANCPDQIRKARTDRELFEAYRAAMGWTKARAEQAIELQFAA